MKKFLLTILVGVATAHGAESLAPAKIASTLKRVADWQLAHPNGTSLRDWVIAPLYDGLIDLSEVTGDPKYLAAVIDKGIQSGWEPGDAVYFADDHAVGHAWLDIYLMDPSQKLRLEPFKKRFDAILAKPLTDPIVDGKVRKKGVETTDRWTWCDALYMGPPTWAGLAKATGDPRYLDFLDAEYKFTYDLLFDPEENLFYRDGRFIGKKTPNGKKVLWSRGNGWVFAGLPMLLEAYPQDRERRKFYVELFQKMAPAVGKAQQPDGLWRPSLMDPDQIAIGETSGSAFFVYGLAWGVEHGLLNREKYWPAIERGWNAILTRIAPDGTVGYVQRIGFAPDHLTAESTQLYGTGAVLMAGSEILRALGAAADVKPSDLLASAEKIVAEDNTPRAYARLVPERSDDLAWENDKVVHRIYGPALREGKEASGMDVWVKNVARPVLNAWYADDLAGRRSYHTNGGEGYDGYSVGDSSGAGGTGIWHDGGFVHADVYEKATISFTKPDVAEFQVWYSYPPIDGTIYHEMRRVRLRLGERLNEITARFTLDSAGRKPAANLDVAVGLIAQTPKRNIELKPEQGIIAVWDLLQPGDSPFGIGALVPPGAKMVIQPHASSGPEADAAFAILRTDARGEVSYRVGSAWSGDGEITSAKAWFEWLSRKASKAGR